MARFSIIESFSEGKAGDPILCEDAIFQSDHFVAVIDGATPKTDRKFGGKTAGRIISEAITSSLGKLHPEAEARAALKHITEVVRETIVLPYFGRTKRRNHLPNASAVIYSDAKKEIWRLGDCAFSIDGTVNVQAKLIDRVNANFRAAYNVSCVQAGIKYSSLLERDLGREKIMPMLKKQSEFMNNKKAGEYGFGSIDGTDEALDFLEVFDVSAASEVVLASDGYPILANTLTESEEKLFKIIEKDPLFIYAWKATKGMTKGLRSFDDRSYLRIRLN